MAITNGALEPVSMRQKRPGDSPLNGQLCTAWVNLATQILTLTWYGGPANMPEVNWGMPAFLSLSSFPPCNHGACKDCVRIYLVNLPVALFVARLYVLWGEGEKEAKHRETINKFRNSRTDLWSSVWPPVVWGWSFHTCFLIYVHLVYIVMFDWVT